MKRLTTSLLWLAAVMAVTAALAANKQETGQVDGNRYRDRRYGFSFQKYDNWKYGKIAQEDLNKPLRIRFKLTQSNYYVPADRRANLESFTPPSLGLWVDTSSLPVDSIMAAITDSRSKLKWRKDLATAVPIISKGSIQDASRIQINGESGVRQAFRLEYEAQTYDRSRDRYSVINDALIGELFVVKHGGQMYVFYMLCERVVYPQVTDEIKNMILSMDFNPPADSSGGSGN
ncbi:MAG: hypothetical protein AB1792_03180 [Candidatus Zixiibacteriota bacterium]